MDDFERKHTLVAKEKYQYLKKILDKCPRSYGYPFKNFFAYSFVSAYSKHLLFFLEKKVVVGVHPPPIPTSIFDGMTVNLAVSANTTLHIECRLF